MVRGCAMVTFRYHHKRYPAESPHYRLDKSLHLCLGALVSARYADGAWYRARIVAIYQSKGLPRRCGGLLL